ncbi:ParA family protein [Flavobacterium sp. MFBS3-15]|uniref:ParA family protein n=1 Tax=Flavobacterium sp. MFBS3-15 TaxID=2989816 RepID=UPI0022366590|nr:ParA family protein [Flavobacterium sp. MFBS3-15]MCW4470210.1 ParA family protein [Flavobacterium sp. MFBS3-15]
METQHNTLFVAFASQKGGVGKSTFTSLVASSMHYRLGYNVAVLDCDFPQYSLAQMRERDMKAVMENEAFKKMAHRQFLSLNKKAYPILQHRAENALEAAQEFIASSEAPIDILFFDLPGTVNSAGIIKALAGMHYVFTPIIADRVVMESTLVFTQLITDVLMKQQSVSIKEVYLFWNQVDGRERNPLYESYGEFIRTLGLKLMKNTITNSVRFRKESEPDAKAVFRSSLLPADERLMEGCNLDAFINEFLQILNSN